MPDPAHRRHDGGLPLDEDLDGYTGLEGTPRRRAGSRLEVLRSLRSLRHRDVTAPERAFCVRAHDEMIGATRDETVTMAKLKDIVFDCENAPRLARFWAAAVDDYDIRPYDDAEIQRLAALGLTPDADPMVVVDGPRGSLLFQQVPESKIGKNRVHVDLISTDRERETER